MTIQKKRAFDQPNNVWTTPQDDGDTEVYSSTTEITDYEITSRCSIMFTYTDHCVDQIFNIQEKYFAETNSVKVKYLLQKDLSPVK